MNQPALPAPPALAGDAPAEAARGARTDLYAGPHKALRRELGDMLHALGRVDVADETELRSTLQALQAVLALLRSHMRQEDDFLHTALEARRPTAALRSAGEHIEQLLVVADLEQEAAALASAPPARRPLLAQRLYRRFAVFVAEQLLHMQLEESLNNATLWTLYRDDELRAVRRRQLAALPPGERDALLVSLARSLAPPELAEIVADAAGTLAGEALVGTLARLGSELGPARAARLERDLRAALAPAGLPAHTAAPATAAAPPAPR